LTTRDVARTKSSGPSSTGLSAVGVIGLPPPAVVPAGRYNHGAAFGTRPVTDAFRLRIPNLLRGFWPRGAVHRHHPRYTEYLERAARQIQRIPSITGSPGCAVLCRAGYAVGTLDRASDAPVTDDLG
jgi:hypothetical protein